ncbi:MAG: hypothetical protein ACC682_08255 [Gemmatimonadota bacterium]
MNAYLLKRVGAFALIFVALELLASVAWLLLHGTDRASVRDAGPEIERLSVVLADDREWLSRRVEFGATIDELRERLRRGGEAFETGAGFDSARALHAERVGTWNAGHEEHERRVARADSLAAIHDSLVAVYGVAYRRAYPGWLVLPRPDPPRQAEVR